MATAGAWLAFHQPGVADAARMSGWRHSASLWVLTTPRGVALPATARVQGFPILVRLARPGFDFSTARPGGEDLRFTTAGGDPLPFEVEEWDPGAGRAAIWVRVPEVRGDDEQEIRMHWGHDTANGASDAAAVFGPSDGHVAVWHWGRDGRDAVRGVALEAKDSQVETGLAGSGRRPGPGGMVAAGVLEGHSTGSGANTTEAWVRLDRPNGTVIGWGREAAQGKVVLQVKSPSHGRVDGYFSDANVEGGRRMATGEWTHLVHTYERGVARLYVNGELDTTGPGRAAALSMKAPSRLWLGCWHGHDVLAGVIDEARVASVARSPEWIRLSHGNQKPFQELVGHLVTPGEDWGVSPASLKLREGGRARVRALAGGARRVWWTWRMGADERVVSTGTLEHELEAGRVKGTGRGKLVFHAAFAGVVRTAEVPVEVEEAIPDPDFVLEGPARWDGRRTVEVLARLRNEGALKAAGAPETRWTWEVEGMATTREALPGRLRLLRAHRSGVVRIRALASNGGETTGGTLAIPVKEPGRDPWVPREVLADERPEDNQLYARDDRGEGTVTWRGRSGAAGARVFLRALGEDGRVREATRRVARDGSHQVELRIPAGLTRHRIEMGTRVGRVEQVLLVATNVVCGDAYLVMGQSNAVATDFGKEDPDWHNPWIRSFGSMSWEPEPRRGWGEAVARDRQGEVFQVGYWAMELGRRLVESEKVPVCLINGAVGGTRIDQHQRSAVRPDDPATLYGRLLGRVRAARLTHGIRGILWHQGENDQGADGPSGGFGWETYRGHFIDLAGCWRQDYPNVRHVHLFQIWPRACAMGVGDSDNRLREVQRRLPEDFGWVHVMSTLGIDPPGGCHYPAAGYAEIARLVLPLVQRDHHGRRPAGWVTPPNIVRARFLTPARDEVEAEFDQPVQWMPGLEKDFWVGEAGGPRVLEGRAAGTKVWLRLEGSARGGTLGYLDGRTWKPGRVLRGTQGIAALTFTGFPVEEPGARPSAGRGAGEKPVARRWGLGFN